METLINFIKEYNILGSIIAGVIGAIAMISSMRIFSKKVKADSKLMMNNHASKTESDIASFKNEVNNSLAALRKTIDAGFDNINKRFEELEQNQMELQQKAKDNETIIQGKFESLFTTVNQWLGNIDNLYTLIHDTILPNILNNNNSANSQKNNGKKPQKK